MSNAQNITQRATALEVGDESRSLTGYGIVFNSDSVPMRVYDPEYGVISVYERITRDSLEEADMSSVIAAINHDFGKVLGRTDSGTLNLTVDENGVKYRVNELPDTSYANDLLVSLRRSDISGSSFVFTMDWDQGYTINERDNGDLEAIPKKITRVYEMGPVTNPAYPETTAENRSGALEGAVKQYFDQKREEAKEASQAEQQNKENQWREIAGRIRLQEVE